jgi:hypothetical protein
MSKLRRLTAVTVGLAGVTNGIAIAAGYLVVAAGAMTVAIAADPGEGSGSPRSVRRMPGDDSARTLTPPIGPRRGGGTHRVTCRPPTDRRGHRPQP